MHRFHNTTLFYSQILTIIAILNPIDSMQSTMSSLLAIFLLVLYCIFYRQDFAFYVMIRSLPGGYILCVIITCIRSFFQPRLKHVTDGGDLS